MPAIPTLQLADTNPIIRMKQYEVTFIIDPVLSGEQIKSIADKYVNFLTANNCSIVHIDEMGLRQLAYPINRRNSGVYYCIEFQSPDGVVINPLELNMRRDEQLLRFLTVALDKYGIKYNDDKRAGLIGKKKPAKTAAPIAAAVAAEPIAEPVVTVVEEVEAAVAVKEETPAAKTVETPAAPAIEIAQEENLPVAEEVPAAESVETPAPEVEKDDLKKIEGIGPKIEELLNNAGILTFAQLAATDADKMRDILQEAGSRFTMHDPATWGDQAQLAAAGNWDDLKMLQEQLQGGREVDVTTDED